MNDVIWKDIPGYEGYYKISNYGQVKAVKREIEGICKGTKYKRVIRERLLKHKLDERGYIKYCLSKECHIKLLSAHRLVMYAFSHIDETLTVNHIDSNKLNNHISNLEYLSNLDNINHYLNLKGKSIIRVLDKEKNIIYESKNAAAKALQKQINPLSKTYKGALEKINRNISKRFELFIEAQAM